MNSLGRDTKKVRFLMLSNSNKARRSHIPYPTLEDIKQQVVVTNTGCWEWQGTRQSAGYGLLGHRYVHRLAWALSNGTLPTGMQICHHCDNPPCCNPAHLFLGTGADNAQDSVSKGRHGSQLHPEIRAEGRSIPLKISAVDVYKIRALEGQMSYRAIARLFKITHFTARRIILRQSRKYA